LAHFFLHGENFVLEETGRGTFAREIFDVGVRIREENAGRLASWVRQRGGCVGGFVTDSNGRLWGKLRKANGGAIL
jgi:hypothetical protein